MSAETELSSGGVATEDAAGPAVGRRAFVCGTVAAATAAGTVASGPAAAQEDPYRGWFDGVDNYEGTVDLRGDEEVTVAVGAGDDGLQFDPAAILVDPGTTVVWEWTGVGSHNVVHEPPDGGEVSFESELYGEEGETFEQTFDDAEEGIYRYYCAPHREVGMKGAVAIGNVDDELLEPSGGGSGGDGGGQSLSTTDLFVAGVGLLLGIALVLAVVRPGFVVSDRA